MHGFPLFQPGEFTLGHDALLQRLCFNFVNLEPAPIILNPNDNAIPLLSSRKADRPFEVLSCSFPLFVSLDGMINRVAH